MIFLRCRQRPSGHGGGGGSNIDNSAQFGTSLSAIVKVTWLNLKDEIALCWHTGPPSMSVQGDSDAQLRRVYTLRGCMCLHSIVFWTATGPCLQTQNLILYRYCRSRFARTHNGWTIAADVCF